jgi:hypothetical protein
MKIISVLSLFALVGTSVFAADSFTTSGRCATQEGYQYVKNGRDGRDIKPSLNAIARAAGQKLQIYSCYRSQAVQNGILAQRGCNKPGANCSQSVARVSQHTKSIAADIKKFASASAQCKALAQGRNAQGGMGGVGTYPRGDGHFDVGSSRSWNLCKGIVAPAKGYSSPVVQRYNNRSTASSGGSCYPTRSFPNCCGPIRARRGLCSM